MKTCSVTITDKVSDICLSLKTACLIIIMAVILDFNRAAIYDDDFHIVTIFLGIKSRYFPSKVQ